MNSAMNNQVTNTENIQQIAIQNSNVDPIWNTEYTLSVDEREHITKAPLTVAANFTQSILPNAVLPLIVDFAGPVFILAANKGLFEDIHILTRQTSQDNVQVLLKLTDNSLFDYLLGLHPQDGLKLQRFVDNDSVEQSGYFKIPPKLNEEELDVVEPNAVSEFIGNFSSNDDLDLVFGFISDLLNITIWEDKHGLKRFLLSEVEDEYLYQ